jgi:quinol monooxygenase YgiN
MLLPQTDRAMIVISTFTMRRGREAGALKLVRAVEREALRSQPGTLVYLANRVIDAQGKPTRTLYFYEIYASKAALNAHLASASWQAVKKQWNQYFDPKPAKIKFAGTGTIDFFGVKRIAAFARKGSIPAAGKGRRK